MWLWWIIFCWRKVGLLVLCLATDKNAGLVALATLRYCCLLMGWNGIFFFKILYFILPLCFVYSPLRLKWPVIWEQNHLTDEKLYHFELWQKDEDPAVVPVHYECIVHCVLLLYDIRMQLSQNIPIGLMSFKLRQTSVYMVHTDKACIFLINVFSWCLFDWLHQSEIKKKKKNYYFILRKHSKLHRLVLNLLFSKQRQQLLFMNKLLATWSVLGEHIQVK